jgi:hypothetical protein
MGFIRIVTGALCLYVHLVYTLDLYSFFGKDAWYSLNTANRDRHEFPWQVNSFWDWEWQENPKSARFPEEVHRKKAVLAYVRSLPFENPAALDKGLRLLDSEQDLKREFERAGRAWNPNEVAGGTYHFLVSELVTLCDPRPSPRPRLGPDPEIRRGTLNAILDKKLRDEKEKYPVLLDQLSEEERKQKVQQLDDFYQTLPQIDQKEKDATKVQTQKENLQFVVEYFAELDPVYRRNFVRMIRDLAAVSPEERERRLDYWSYWNIERRYNYTTGNPIFSFWFHITDPVEMAIAHTAVILIMVMFTVGFQTRITSVLTWLAAVSYLHRNPQVLFGQDTMMNILLIYLMVANSGAALSVDRWLACRKAKRLSIARSGTIDAATAAFLAAPPPSVSTGFAQRLLQVHFCFIYMAAGLSKLKGAAWWNHNAFWDTLINPEFTMVHFEWYENLLRWTASSRPAFAAVAAAGVWFTLFIEISLPFLVWTKMRPWAVILGFMLHAGVGVFMGLLIFSLFMMVMLFSYLPGQAVRQALFASDRDIRR